MRSEDGNIIYECLNGDSASFGLLVDKYKASIYALAYSKLRNFHDAEDVTQEVFIKAYKSLHTLRRWDSFLVWIRSMTINFCRDKIKTSLSRPDKEYIEDQGTYNLEKSSSEIYQKEQWITSHKETLDLLDESLKTLPESYRQILTLHYLGGMSGEQISQFLSISHANVRQRLSRAREQLREEMIAMISQTFKQQKLSASFTFRIVEMVKKIKINPISEAKNLPWGISVGVGVIFAILSINSHLITLKPIDVAYGGMPLSSESRIMSIGEIPVDVLKTDYTPLISSNQGEGDAGKPELQKATYSATQSQKGKWTKKADMLTARLGLSACVVNGKLYAIGGTSNWGDVTYSAVEEYDQATDKWSKKADMLTERCYFSTASLNGRIYAIGGGILPTLSLMEEYDSLRDRWTKKADMPTERWGLSACAANGKIYAIGGANDYKWETDRAMMTFLTTIEEYDPVTNEWAKKSDMPTPRAGLTTSVVNGKIYAIGGTHDYLGQNDYIGLSAVEEYDPINDKWTKKADMPTARLGASAVTINGKIYIISGTDRWPALKTLDEYDPATDTWTKMADIPTARAAFGADAIDGKIYAIGGFDGAMWVSTVEEFDIEAEDK